MGDPYQPGTEVGLSVDFTVGADVPTDPTTVTFNVRQPDNSLLTYVYGVDDNVIRLGVGVYKCVLTPSMSGEYRYNAVGTGTVPVSVPGTFVVAESNVAPPAPPPPGPHLGPCQQWIAGEDIAAAGGLVIGDNTSLLDAAATEASMALFEISGRRFSGICTRTVRPCRDSCQCWGPSSLGLGPWYWSSWPTWGTGYMGWANEAGDKFGCEPMSKVRLAGYPVRKILAVTIDGNDIPEFDAIIGARNWRLDLYRDLIRMDAPGPPVTKRWWPACQNMSLDGDQPGTFEISYEWGQDPPQLGRSAAIEIAQQLYLAFSNQDCKLPAGTTRVTRQGITVERGLLANWFDPKKPTGLINLDTFLKAYWATRTIRRPMVYSPDLQPYAREVGSP